MADELERQLAQLKHGDHLCPICESADERMAIAVGFLKEGLARGECCLYIGDERSGAEVARSHPRRLGVVGQQVAHHPFGGTEGRVDGRVGL